MIRTFREYAALSSLLG